MTHISQAWRQYCLGLLLCLCGALWCTNSYAQTCGQDHYNGVGNLLITSSLSDCSISVAQVKYELGLLDCGDVRLLPNGPYGPNLVDTIYIFDEAKNDIIGRVRLETRAESIHLLSDYVDEPSPGQFLFKIPLAQGECQANKDLLLQHLKVGGDPVILNQIHFIEDGYRLQDFPIGDTVTLDAITCGDQVYYSDVQVLFEQASSPYSDLVRPNLGFTKCEYTIEDFLSQELGYNLQECSLSRFTISNSGPFGYGRHFIDEIKIDNEVIVSGAIIDVQAGTCSTSDIDFGMLDQGKCALNEYDIIDSLGLSYLDCGTGSVKFYPPGPYENSPLTIDSISILGRTVCRSSFQVMFERDTVTQEQGALLCVEDLNIAMGPECMTSINADVILATGDYCYLNYIIDLSFASDPDDVIASGHEVVITQPGMYSLVITNPNTGNSCWSEFAVEDKYIHDYTCPADTVWCFESVELLPDALPGGGPDFPIMESGFQFEATEIFGRYDVISPTTCDVVSASYSDEIVSSCIGDFKQVVDRLWTLEDAYGNQDTCLQRIFVQNTTLDDVVSFDVLDANCIGDFTILDQEGHPSPEVTGYPMVIDTINAGICGTLKMTYRDSEVPVCGNGFKIFREWVIIDWCSNQVKSINQIIRIEDKEAPVILEKLEDFTIGSDPFICGGTSIDLPLPQFTDCNIDEVQVEVLYQTYDSRGDLVTRSNGSSLFIDEIITNDISATFDIIYVLTDPCGNESRDTVAITIQDNQPPTPVCDEFTAISVGGNGVAVVPAFTFDNLSVDNCGIESYEARKLNGTCALREDFSKDIRFCCEEVGDTLLVEFKVTDFAGNYNFCEVQVHVQDKFRPILSRPDDITIDCGVDYTDLDITGQATARDNCDHFEITYTDRGDINQCGQGVIERTWAVTDVGGYVVTDVQLIRIEEDDVFGAHHIQFPVDTIVMGCSASVDPEVTGSPILDESTCANVDATYEDLPFSNVEDACQKILRTWTIIDWCQRDAANGGIWKMDQIIKIVSDEGPVFDAPTQLDYCINSTECADQIQISHSAVDGDACTPTEELRWQYRVINKDGDVVDAGQTREFESLLSVGSYTILYEVVDGCANVSLDTIEIVIRDCTAPMISCPAVQPSLVLDESGVAILPISDIVDLGISDNCTDSSEMIISFADGADELLFTCDDLAAGELFGYVKVYAADAAGNVDSCDLYIEVRDNSDRVCGLSSDTILISGKITNVDGDPIKNVEAQLFSDYNNYVQTTDDEGQYKFENLKQGRDYLVEFAVDADPADGLSVADLVIIQRHILGIKRFESPYDYIAADVNNNGRVSVTDIAKLKRFLIGIDSTLASNGQSDYRFVNAHQSFDHPTSPFPFEDALVAFDAQSSIADQDFMVLKIGDLNGNNSMNGAVSAVIRSSGIALAVVEYEDRMAVIATEDMEISGLHLDLSGLEDDMVLVPQSLSILEDDYSQSTEGWTLVWAAHEEYQDILKGDVLFDIKKSSPYPVSGMDIEGTYVDVHLREYAVYSRRDTQLGEEVIGEVTNYPNPFASHTIVQFELNSAQKMRAMIYDYSGRLVWEEHKDLLSGRHELSLSADDLGGQPGIYLLRLITNQHEKLHRLTLIR